MLDCHIKRLKMSQFTRFWGKFFNVRKYACVKDLTNIMSGWSIDWDEIQFTSAQVEVKTPFWAFELWAFERWAFELFSWLINCQWLVGWSVWAMTFFKFWVLSFWDFELLSWLIYCQWLNGWSVEIQYTSAQVEVKTPFCSLSFELLSFWLLSSELWVLSFWNFDILRFWSDRLIVNGW